MKLSCLDKLALRAGNEKDEDQADTVGCCSLRLEFNIDLSRDTLKVFNCFALLYKSGTIIVLKLTF